MKNVCLRINKIKYSILVMENVCAQLPFLYLLADWFGLSFSLPKLCLSLPHLLSPCRHGHVGTDLYCGSRIRDCESASLLKALPL